MTETKIGEQVQAYPAHLKDLSVANEIEDENLFRTEELTDTQQIMFIAS